MSRLERLEERADSGLSVAVMYVCVCVSQVDLRCKTVFTQ